MLSWLSLSSSASYSSSSPFASLDRALSESPLLGAAEALLQNLETWAGTHYQCNGHDGSKGRDGGGGGSSAKQRRAELFAVKRQCGI